MFFSYIYIFLQCPLTLAEHEVFQVGDKFNILDPYDGAIFDIGWIQSLYMIHGVPLGPEDANVYAIRVKSNIPLLMKIKLMDVNVWRRQKWVSSDGQRIFWENNRSRLSHFMNQLQTFSLLYIDFRIFSTYFT